METQENIKVELESWAENYAEFVLHDFTTPFDEIMWLKQLCIVRFVEKVSMKLKN